jgi:hypothetical protein
LRGAQIRRVVSCTHKVCDKKHIIGISKLSTYQPNHDDMNLLPHTHMHSTHEHAGQIEHPGTLNSSSTCHADTPESYLRRLLCQQSRSESQASSLRDRSSRDSPTNSYASQLRHAKEIRHEGGSWGAVQSYQHESPGLTPVAEASEASGELSIGAWQSPSGDSGAKSELYEQPSMDMFGGTFGTRPDFSPGVMSYETYFLCGLSGFLSVGTRACEYMHAAHKMDERVCCPSTGINSPGYHVSSRSPRLLV